MPESFITCQRCNIGFTIRDIHRFHIKSNASPFIFWMSGCEFSDRRGLENSFPIIGAMVKKHLKKYSQIIYIGKQAGMTTDSIQHGCCHIMDMTLYPTERSEERRVGKERRK